MSSLLILGGAPCSGKTTAADALTRKYVFPSYHLDGMIEKFVHEGMLNGDYLLRYAAITPPEFAALRPAPQQAEEMAEIFRHVFPYVQADIAKILGNGPILCEGAGFLPEFMQELGVSAGQCVFLIPDADFFRMRYASRPWVQGYLSRFPVPEAAFELWMKRTEKFADFIENSAIIRGYPIIRITSESNPAQILTKIESILAL